MHKVAELEKRWFQYRVKKMVSPLVSLSFFSVVVGASYYFYTTKAHTLFSMPLSEKVTNVLGVTMDVNDTLKTRENMVLKEEITPKVNKTVEVPKVSEEMIALAPIIPVIDLEKEERIRDVVKAKHSKTVKRVAAKKNTYLTASELAVITKAEKKVQSVPHKTKKINFKSTTVNYVDTLKAKFEKSKNSRDALLLSKAYYKEGKYKASEQWALSANKLNNSLEDSWLLFAKSKAKLGKKQEAVKILVSYYKKSNSVKAKDLIGQIKTGKI